MVEIYEHMVLLKGAHKTAWRSVTEHPDIQTSHEAVLLCEQFSVIARYFDHEQRPADYRAKLSEAEKAADQFRALLKQSPIDGVKAEDAFKKVGQSCTACHKRYRN